MPWPPPFSARWTALALFLFALALHLFLAMGGLLIGLDFKALVIVDEIFAILAAPLIFALLLRLDLREAFGLRSAHWSHYVMAGLAAIPLQLFGGAMMEIVIESMPGSNQWREMVEGSLEVMLSADTPGELAALIFGAVVLAAICEEVLFRGLMLRLMTLHGRWAGAILITAILFAVFHLDPIGLIPRTLMGIYFGLLVWRSGSLYPAILAHGANNLLAFAAQPLTDPEAPSPELAQAALLAAVAGLVFVGLLWAYVRLSPRASIETRHYWTAPTATTAAADGAATIGVPDTVEPLRPEPAEPSAREAESSTPSD